MHTQLEADAKPKTRGRREVAIVIFGRDSKRKGHAAGFGAEDAGLALKAARLMKLNTWRVPLDAQALALRVPRGKLFGSGRALAPLVNAKLMAELELQAGKSSPGASPGAAGGPAKAPSEPADGVPKAGAGVPGGKGGPPASAAPTRPADWGQIGVGSEVLADCGQPGLGWYEGVVIANHGSDLFDIRWIKYPDEPTVMRHRNDLGLLAPQHIIESM